MSTINSGSTQESTSLKLHCPNSRTPIPARQQIAFNISTGQRMIWFSCDICDGWHAVLEDRPLQGQYAA